MVPNLLGGPPGVWNWDTSARTTGESWSAYCGRVAEESTRIVDEIRVEEESALEVRDQLFFNLTYITEEES